MNELARNIKAYRQENKWTQDELSRKVQLSPKMISFYELGERMPSRESLVRLATVFGVSVDTLLNNAAPMAHPVKKTVQVQASSPMGYNELDDEDKAAIDRMTRQMLELKRLRESKLPHVSTRAANPGDSEWSQEHSADANMLLRRAGRIE